MKRKLREDEEEEAEAEVEWRKGGREGKEGRGEDE